LSTSKAAEIAASEPYSAAIASITCAELYGLEVLKKDIQDAKSNKTVMFFLIFLVLFLALTIVQKIR
jgi:chorismate mutase/prephenate dehydratase